MKISLPEHESNILTNPPNGSHIVKICQNKILQRNSIAYYIKEGLRNNERVIVIAEPVLRKALISKLITLNHDVHTLKEQGQIKFFDTNFLLSTFIAGDVLVEKDFQKAIEIPMLGMQSKYEKIRTFNDMVEVLWKDNYSGLALKVENAWNNLLKKHTFCLLCTYFEKTIHPAPHEENFTRVCDYHTHLIN